ncbi:flagellin [Kurthia sp. 3B1D]|uniref:Flagellin n=1 Tax=Candidatus Kurthia intestinigallinarum TaxID=1562256 RepID=A0A433RTT3_9BACL|nr:flagellin Hag [Kurthia sp. 3B1D]RUS55570.1 flagellin [Kurthia sp. 3B1D]
MRIQHNIAALNTHRNLGMNNAAASKNLEKLSSGYQINRAGDDAAGLAISEKMRGQISGLDMASKNASDSISLIQTAEGALNETHSILQRMRELAVQSANDTNTADDRLKLQSEVDQLAKEINRISNTTEFNTKKLLNGNLEGASQTKAAVTSVAEVKSVAGVTAVASATAVASVATVYTGAANSTVKTPGVAASPSVAAVAGVTSVAGVQGVVGVASTVTDGKLTFHIGANQGQTMNLEVGKMDAKTLGVGNANDEFAKGIDIKTQANSESAITTIDAAINAVSATRSNLGAVQNRLEHTINNLGASSENLTAAESRIRDTDMAKEMMEFTKNNILTQAAQSMLAQANQQPQGVLSLLQ